MLLLLLSHDGFSVLPEIEHLYEPYKSYMAHKKIFVDPKDPNDVVDYQIDWSKLLRDDTISQSTWQVPDGITGESASKTNTTTTIWVSGGSAGQNYAIINRIVTADGRTIERFIIVPVREQ